jgi:ferredoxin--NADP+ reductase
MIMTESQLIHKPLVAVIGAGPAGLFGANSLAENGAQVILLNRDIKPGGLAEYGIYYDKYKVKAGLRKQFQKILSSPDITYCGNVTVDNEAGDLTLDDLRAMGFQAVMVTVGAQGTKWLGLPGEELEGVYHAKDVIYYYNSLPPFSEREFAVGKRVALIGVGNVMADIAHWLIRDIKVDEVIAVARRGPAEVKFDRKEMEYVARNLDVEYLEAEFARVSDRVKAVQQDPDETKAFILSALSDRALEPVSDSRLRFRFLSAPKRILGDEKGRVVGLEVDDTELVLQENGVTKPRRLGTQHILNVDTVIFCIGDKVSETFGLPVEWNEFVKCAEPCYPVNGVCYEVYDPGVCAPIDGVFVAGWSRQASTGQVGLARKDAQNCVKAMMQYLKTQPPLIAPEVVIAQLEEKLRVSGKPVVSKADCERLAKVEQQEAENRGLEDFKFKTNGEMLAAIGLA